jgi:hypothetical protein
MISKQRVRIEETFWDQSSLLRRVLGVDFVGIRS